MTTDDEDGAVAATFRDIPEVVSERMGGFKKVEIVNGYGRWKAVQQPWKELRPMSRNAVAHQCPRPEL